LNKWIINIKETVSKPLKTKFARNSYEKKLKTLEKERPNEMEMAKKET